MIGVAQPIVGLSAEGWRGVQNQPDLTWLADMQADRVIVSFVAGIATEPSPGVILKLVMGSLHVEIVFIPPGLVAPMLDGCRRFLGTPSPISRNAEDAEKMFVDLQPSIGDGDFAAVQQKDVAVRVGFLASRNALGFTLWFTDGRCRGFQTHPAVAFRLGECLTHCQPFAPPVPGRDIPHRS
jgi:hypothetical protein